MEEYSFQPEILKRNLNHSANIIYLSKTTSTNQIAKEYAVNGAEEGTIVVANEQTLGRGRLGRRFFSKNGVYFTLVLRPKLKPEDVILITSAVAVAVCEATKNLGFESPKIKWVNDIFLNNKKVCGILCESCFNSRGEVEFSLLGIGANLFVPKEGFPKEIENIAGSMFDTFKEGVMEKFVANVVNIFMKYYSNLMTSNFPDKYKEYSMIIGKNITYFRQTEQTKALVLDIDNRCRLKVKKEDGEIEFLSSGEVTIGSHNIKNQ